MTRRHGWLRVDDTVIRSDDDLRRWVGIGYARYHPPKEPANAAPVPAYMVRSISVRCI